MFTFSNSRIFYNGESISVVRSNGYCTRVLHIKNLPLFQKQGADKATSSLHATLLATEQNGSILSQIDPTAKAVHTYSAYGYDNPPAEENALFGFTGQFRILRSIYSLGKGYRIYDTGIRRFCSPDSYSPFGRGGLNAYAYCENDPINKVDPTGHAGRSMDGRAPLKPFRKIDTHERRAIQSTNLNKYEARSVEIADQLATFPRHMRSDSSFTQRERLINAEQRIQRAQLLAEKEQLGIQISTLEQTMDLTTPTREPSTANFDRLAKMMQDPNNVKWDASIRADPIATVFADEVAKYGGEIRKS